MNSEFKKPRGEVRDADTDHEPCAECGSKGEVAIGNEDKFSVCCECGCSGAWMDMRDDAWSSWDSLMRAARLQKERGE